MQLLEHFVKIEEAILDEVLRFGTSRRKDSEAEQADGMMTGSR